MKNPFAAGATATSRIVLLVLVILVACGVGVGAAELADQLRGESRDASAVGPAGDVDSAGAWIYDPDRPLGWDQLAATASAPDPRSDHSLVYASVTGRVILFGGRGADGALGDTWAYDVVTRDWTELPASSSGMSPEPRGTHSLTFVPLTNEVVLFGGSGDEGVLGDTWTYDLLRNAWMAAAPGEPLPAVISEPVARQCHAAAFDPVAGRVILFGGLADADEVLGDTWSYDPIRRLWTELHAGGDGPAPRHGHSMVFDPTSGRVIMVGGTNGEGTVLDETWAYDSGNDCWTQLQPLSPMPGRSASAAACASTTGTLTLFGGHDPQNNASADTWTYDFDGSWVRVYAGDVTPSARASSSMVYCELTDTHLLFGGRDEAGNPLSDTWIYWSPAKWW